MSSAGSEAATGGHGGPAPPLLLELEVGPDDVDELGMARYGALLRWLGLGRAAALDSCGVGEELFDQCRRQLILVEVRARYRAPAVLRDRIELWITTALETPHSLAFSYRLQRGAGSELLADGCSTHRWRSANGREGRIPLALVERLGAHRSGPRKISAA